MFFSDLHISKLSLKSRVSIRKKSGVLSSTSINCGGDESCDTKRSYESDQSLMSSYEQVGDFLELTLLMDSLNIFLFSQSFRINLE